MRSNLKVKLHDFRNTLPIEMNDVASIVSEHIDYTDTHSEKEILHSLQMLLEKYSFNSKVKGLLESIDTELSEEPLLYALKDIYYKLSRKQDKFLYEAVKNAVLECINSGDEEERKLKILNDLPLYEWVAEVNALLYNMTENPQMRANLTSVGGLVEDVYSILLESENGYLTYIDNAWYLLNEGGVSETLLEYHIKDTNTLRRLRLLEEACNIAKFDEHSITFEIAENLNLTLNTETKEIFINDNVKEIETTLETLFNSPVVPFECKSFYPVINETYTNLDKFANITAAKYVWNPINKAFESIIFNFGGKFYQKRKDKSSSSFLQFDKALPLIENLKRELGADVTFFFEENLEDEVKAKLQLENQVKSLSEKLEKIEESIFMIKEEKELLEEDKSIENLYNTLLVKKHKLSEQIKETKNKLFNQ